VNHLHYAVVLGFHTFRAQLLQRMTFFKVSPPQVIIAIQLYTPFMSGTTIHNIFVWIIWSYYEKNFCYTCL